jgi:hypothetical protein
MSTTFLPNPMARRSEAALTSTIESRGIDAAMQQYRALRRRCCRNCEESADSAIGAGALHRYPGLTEDAEGVYFH